MAFILRREKGAPKAEIPWAEMLIYAGGMLAAVSLLILVITFYPVAREELKYDLITSHRKQNVERLPADKDFGIYIPKIGADAKIIANVDWKDQRAYQNALTKGVAHAAGTSLPGHAGNTFLFAHSAGNWYQANRYNAIFYLLSKLEKKDLIIATYKNDKYRYRVTDKKTVDATALEYLAGKNGKPMLTLMTCWPPGTTMKRMIVTAEMIKN